MTITFEHARYLMVDTFELSTIIKSINGLHSKYGITPNYDQFSLILQHANRAKDYYFSDIVDTIAMSGSLSEEACDALRRGAENIKKRLVDIYTQQGLSTSDRQRDADMSIRDYCWHLNQIRRHNGGILPDEFQLDWRLNSCDAFKF
jgi:hypothetical protein